MTFSAAKRHGAGGGSAETLGAWSTSRWSGARADQRSAGFSQPEGEISLDETLPRPMGECHGYSLYLTWPCHFTSCR